MVFGVEQAEPLHAIGLAVDQDLLDDRLSVRRTFVGDQAEPRSAFGGVIDFGIERPHTEALDDPVGLERRCKFYISEFLPTAKIHSRRLGARDPEPDFVLVGTEIDLRLAGELAEQTETVVRLVSELG